MTLTLGNDLTGSVAREVSEASRKSSGLGESLTTGNNKFVEVVDGFLGSSLRDNEIVLGAIAKNTAYSINMLNVADEYLKIIAESFQDCLKIVANASAFSKDKIVVLQKNLDDKREQIAMLTRTAKFDSKILLGGDASAVEVGAGLSNTDKVTVKIKDIGSSKLFRSTIVKQMNDYFASNLGSLRYYQTQQELDRDVDNNVNLLNAASLMNGSGTGRQLTEQEFRSAVRLAIAERRSIGILLNDFLPESLARMKAGGNIAGGVAVPADPNVDFTNANQNQLALALPYMAVFTPEIANTFYDNQGLISIGDSNSRLRALNIFTHAINTIRSEQANVANQKANILEISNALRATTNVTQKAADSYLKTDYVMTAQQYSETIRTMVASITALQAANKIPEAAQRLIDALAR